MNEFQYMSKIKELEKQNQELREQHLGSEGRQGLHQQQARDFLYV